MEIDKRRKTVLRTVILVAVVLAAAGIILLIFRLADTKVDTGKGLERLAALEKTDVASVEQKIQELEAAERAADPQAQPPPRCLKAFLPLYQSPCRIAHRQDRPAPQYRHSR